MGMEFATAAELRAHYGAISRRLGMRGMTYREPPRPTEFPIEAIKALSPWPIAPPPPLPPLSWGVAERIVRATAREFGISVELMRSERRGANVSRARQVAAHLMRLMTNLSMPAIGKRINRDHSTIFHACQRVEEMLRADAALAEKVAAIRADVESVDA